MSWPANDYRNPAFREHFVYRAFDASGRLLYVGCSMSLSQRWAAHRVSSVWAKDAVRFRIQGPYNYDTARAIERKAIWTESPIHNGTGPAQSLKQRRYAVERRRTAELMDEGVDFQIAWRMANREAMKAVPA